jgi:hypothetical protein
LQEKLLLYIPFKNLKKVTKTLRKKRIFNFYIQTTSLKNCGDEWTNLQEYASNLASSKDFSIWNDSSIKSIKSMSISMNIEKYDFTTNIVMRPHFNNTYKNTI